MEEEEEDKVEGVEIGGERGSEEEKEGTEVEEMIPVEESSAGDERYRAGSACES